MLRRTITVPVHCTGEVGKGGFGWQEVRKERGVNGRLVARKGISSNSEKPLGEKNRCMCTYPIVSTYSSGEPVGSFVRELLSLSDFHCFSGLSDSHIVSVDGTGNDMFSESYDQQMY